MDIVESKKTCSVKTSLLTAMLCDEGPSVLDEDKRARVVSCFVGEGNWNVDSQRFEGVPDWDRVKVKLLRVLAEPHGNGEVVMMSSQQWAAPRENGSSSAMMISPAISERLSDRAGQCPCAPALRRRKIAHTVPRYVCNAVCRHRTGCSIGGGFNYEQDARRRECA